MTKNNLPKNCRMKKISASELVYVKDGLASNGHWLVDTEWLLSLQKVPKSLGFTAFKNRIQREVVKHVSGRINGVESQGLDLRKYYNEYTERPGYKEVPRSKINFETGFFRGDHARVEEVVLNFSTKDSPHVDIEYSAAFFLDSSLSIFILDGSSPVLLKDKTGKTIYMVMPLNPKARGE